MQQSLDRRQPSARFRAQLREIPLQRRYGAVGNGENKSPALLVGNEPDARTGPDTEAGIAVTAGPEVLEEHAPDLRDRGLTAGDVPGTDELSAAAPAAEPLDPPGPEVLGGDAHQLFGISDRAWEWIGPLLPSSTGRQGGRWRDHRQVVEAICWKYRTGSPWRDLPARFGPWQTAYHRSSRWSADGTWARLLARAQIDADAAGELDWLVAIESTVARVHQHGASARRVGGIGVPASPCDSEEGAAA